MIRIAISPEAFEAIAATLRVEEPGGRRDGPAHDLARGRDGGSARGHARAVRELQRRHPR
jgi:hypothetical protein